MYLKTIDLETTGIAFLPTFLIFHHLSFSGTVTFLIHFIRPITFTALAFSLRLSNYLQVVLQSLQTCLPLHIFQPKN